MLTRQVASITGMRMGRPSLEVKETKVYLAPGQRERIAALVGTYGNSKFIREAVEAELLRREGERGEPPSTTEAL